MTKQAESLWFGSAALGGKMVAACGGNLFGHSMTRAGDQFNLCFHRLVFEHHPDVLTEHV